MDLTPLFHEVNEKEFQNLSKSPLYKILNKSLKYIQIDFFERNEDEQFHFDCENKSKRNIYQIIFELLSNKQRNEILKNVGLRRFKQIPEELEKDNSLIILRKRLKNLNVDVQVKNKESYCIYLRNQQDASCVGSLLHGVNLKNQLGSQRFKDFHLDALNEYANNDQVIKVKNYFKRNRNIDLNFKYGSSLVICYYGKAWQYR